MDVIDKLKARRLELGWSRDTLASKSGYPVNTIGLWERREVSPTLRSLIDWSQALGLTLETKELSA